MIQHCIAEHMEEGQFTTTSREEAEAYLGFRIPLPDQLLDGYECQKYYLNATPLWIQCMCDYIHDEKCISITLYCLTDVNDSILFMEQNNDGERININGMEVYTSKNTDNSSFILTDNNIVIHIIGKFELDQGIMIVKDIRRK